MFDTMSLKWQLSVLLPLACVLSPGWAVEVSLGGQVFNTDGLKVTWESDADPEAEKRLDEQIAKLMTDEEVREMLEGAGIDDDDDDVDSVQEDPEDDFHVSRDVEENRGLRLVNSSVPPNRVIDVLVNNLFFKLFRNNLHARRPVNTILTGNIPFNTDVGTKNVVVQVTNLAYLNIGGVRRGEAARYLSDQNLMWATLMFNNLTVTSDYTIRSPPISFVPSTSARGNMTGRAEKFFIDASFIVDITGLPVGIRSFSPQSGRFFLDNVTGLTGDLVDFYTPLLRDSARSLLERLTTRWFFTLVSNTISNLQFLAQG